MSEAGAEGLVATWRKAMEGVTPGEWLWRGKDGGLYQEGKEGYAYGDAVLLPVYEYDSGVDTKISDADAAWVARCSPAGISELLAALEAHARALAEAGAEIERLRGRLSFALDEGTSWAVKAGEFARKASDAEARPLSQDQEIAGLREEVRRKDEALKPFADFAQWTDADGWTCNIHREGISVWFGPSDFRRARTALSEA